MWSFFSKDPSKDLNYELLECVSNGTLDDKTIWSVHNGKKKGTSNDLVTIFAFNSKTPTNETSLTIAKNGYKRMKIVRHPNILTFIDGLETDKAVYVVTERVQPLSIYLNESKDNESQKENAISWGLHQIATALGFLNNDCKIIHNNIAMHSIFVNKAGEWKLSGLEFSFNVNDENLINKNSVISTLSRYEPPERLTGGSKVAIDLLWSIDSWGFGCLIWEIFNGTLPNTNSLANQANISKRLQSVFRELVNANPRNRLNSVKFLDICRQRNGFMDNHFVNTLLFLEQIQIKDQNEKTKFFTELTEKLDDFPHNLCLYLILPQLLNAYEFGNAGSSILAPLFKLGKMLDESEYQKKIIPIVVKLFTSTDRTTRMRLLQQLNLFIEHLSPSVINDQLFPHICQGFCDSAPAIREHTIRAMVLLASKLNYNNLNIELMKHFARLQSQDDQGMIRTNTTVCIGKIAPYINPQLRQRILLSAFPKAMRDPFPPARLSGVIALANTDRFYTLRDIASKVMPCLCLACIDPDKDVRDEVFKTIKIFLNKFEKISESPELAAEMEKDVNSCTLDVKNETSWTSWAMTSLTAKLSDYKNKQQQPSVALSATGESKKAIENASTNNKQQTTPDNKINKNEKTTPSPPAVSSTTSPSSAAAAAAAAGLTTNNSPFAAVSSFDSNSKSSGKDGWTVDQWQDMDEIDDDDQMEPLEPFSTPSTNTNLKTLSSATKKSNDGWDSFNDNNWSTSFDNDSTSTSKNSNWNSNAQKTTPSTAINEEELFASLVKDTKNLTTRNQTKTNDWNKSDWSNNDWNSVETTGSNDAKKQERDERNAQKLKEQNAKRQSKPLKLGAKRLDD